MHASDTRRAPGQRRSRLRPRYLLPALFSLLTMAGTATGTEGLSVTDQQLVASQRAGRTFSDYTFTITVANTGGALRNVIATVSSNSPYTEVLDGEVMLGDLNAGEFMSADSFQIRQHRRFRFDPAKLVWSFSADDPPPVGTNAPVIISQPVTDGSVERSYRYAVQATDTDAGDVLAYRLLRAPAGMTIGETSGVVTWTPTQAGAVDVDLEVVDSTGLTDRQLYLLRVDNGPDDAPPSLQPIADLTTVVAQRVSTQATGLDPEGELLRFGIVAGPAGLGINSGTGAIAWTPEDSQTGSFTVTVNANDPGGLSAETSFVITVLEEAPNNAPQLAFVPDQTVNALAGFQLSLEASDADDGDLLTYSLTPLPAGAQFDTRSGTLGWSPGSDQTGTSTYTASVTDSAGDSASRSFQISVKEPPQAPVAVDDAYTVAVRGTLNVAAPGVLGNDSDGNGDLLTASTLDQPTLGTLDTFQGDGSFIYVPPEPPPITLGLQAECETSGNDFANSGGIAVADVDRDGEVEMVDLRALGNNTVLVVRSGRDCSEKLRVPLAGNLGQTHFNLTPALVNLDDDPELEVVSAYARFNSEVTSGLYLLAVNLDGTPVWSNTGNLSEPVTFDVFSNFYTGAPVPVDLDQDGKVELLMVSDTAGASAGGFRRTAVVAIDGETGAVLWEHLGELSSSTRSGQGPLLVDLDLNGTTEIIWHRSVLNADGTLRLLLPTELTQRGGTVSRLLNIAAGNFDDDPYPELLAHDDRNHYLFEHTGALKWQRSRPASTTRNTFLNRITIAQLDDDPRPEYVIGFPPQGTVTGYGFMAFDDNGDELWRHQDRGWQEPGFQAEKLSQPVAFDFDRDGIDELVATHWGSLDGTLPRGLHIFRGSDGAVLASFEADVVGRNVEAVTIADVDDDGAAEILFNVDRGLGARTHVVVLGGLPDNPFPPAGRVRTFGAFQPTWANDDGSVPANLRPHWLIPGFNKTNFAAVIPGEDTTTQTAFRYEASDGTSTAEATVRISLSAVDAPEIVSKPPLRASPGFAYRYGALATHADTGEPLTWTLVDAPAGMTVDPFGIVSWTPETSALGASRVQLVVTDSNGDADSQTFTILVQPPVTVPELLGLEEATAVSALRDGSFTVGNVRQAYSLTVPAGSVISQSTAPGAESAAGAIIDIVISLGPQPIYVPNLTGLPQSTAAATLADLTLAVGSVSFVNDPSAPRGTVVTQGIAAFQPVTAGTAVNLVLSGGPAMIARLAQDLLAPGQTTMFTLQAFDPSGTPIPLPADLELAIAAEDEARGTLPILSDGQLVSSGDTEGAFNALVRSENLDVALALPFAVSALYAADGLQSGYGRFSGQLTRLSTLYDELANAVRDGDLPQVATLAADLQTLRNAMDLADLSLTPAVGLVTGFLSGEAPDFPSSTADAFERQLTRTLGEVGGSLTFLQRLNAATARDDDQRAVFLNASLERELDALLAVPLLRRSTVLERERLFELLSLQLPALVAANADVVLGALTDAGLLARSTTAPEAFASHVPNPAIVQPRPAFFSLLGVLTASQVRMTIVKQFYLPMVKGILKNTQNLFAAGLIQDTIDTVDVPGIVTGASLSFHNFELQGSIVEAFSASTRGDGHTVLFIGPTLLSDLQSTLGTISGSRFSSMKAAKDTVNTVRDAVAATDQTLRDGFRQASPDTTLNGCVFTSLPGCRQLSFSPGLPVVNRAGVFPAPVLILVYDAVSGQLSIGNFLFFPKAP